MSSGRLSWSRVLIGRRPRHTSLRLVVLVLASIGVFGYCLLPVRTQGISMLPTYEPGSLKFVNALAYTWSQPQRGDIVAIRLAGRRVVYLKRIIGLPTERVRIDAGMVYTDGVALDEPYVRHRAAWTVERVALAADEYFVVGDNRGMPSAQHEFGTVARAAHRGEGLVLTRAAQLGVGLVAAGLVVWLGFGRSSSEVRQISRRLDALAETASVGSGDTNLVRMAKAARLAGYFTEDVTLDLGSPSTVIRGRDALRAMAARTQMSPEGLRIELVDVQITVAAEEARAIASMTVQGSGIDFATGDQMIDAREIEMTLVKLDGEWLIQGVSAVSAIRRPGTPAPIRDRP